MSENKIEVSGGGCGCVSIVVFILLFWSIFFGLPIGDKVYNVDIFPPAIRIEKVGM